MTPEQSKNVVQQEYERLVHLHKKKPKLTSCVFNITKNLAQVAARSHGIPEMWKEFMPEELLIEQGLTLP